MVFIIAKTLSLKNYTEAVLLGAYVIDISSRIEVFSGEESITCSFSYKGIQVKQIFGKICKNHVWISSVSIINVYMSVGLRGEKLEDEGIINIQNRH